MSRAMGFEAMGTWVEVRAGSTTTERPVRQLFEQVEARCSRFRPSSELNRLNRATGDSFRLSSDLARIFSAAADLGHRTAGLVDPAVGARVVEWGYDRTFSAVEGVAALPARSWYGAPWRLDGRMIRRAPGTRFDLGGIAKGWTADLAVQSGLADVVSAGGDLRSADPAATVDVVDPWGDVAVSLAVGVGGLATSTISRRRWRSAAGEVHHIIDPRTGDPAVTPVLSATAVAATATEAEAAAKAVLILGDSGLAWAAGQSWIRAAVVVWHDGNVYATPETELAA